MGATSGFFVAASEITSIRGTGELLAAAGAVADDTAILEDPPGVFASARFVVPVAGDVTGADVGAAEGGVACCEGG